VTNNSFDVTIIPYTYDNTNFNKINIGDIVNIEYDMIGKYLARFNNK
jgi:riboflavin synthase